MTLHYTLAIFTLSIFLTNAKASLINFQSGSLNSYLQSDGSTNLDNTYTFALGTFDESILSSPISNWSSGFTNQMSNTNSWITPGEDGVASPAYNTFQGDVIMSGDSANGLNAYIWGISSSNNDIILFKNASWIFPLYSSTDLEADIFSLSDTSTEVINSEGSFIAFNNNLLMLNAVPEPSNYASIIGFMALSLALLRRGGMMV